jgi:trehalose/maltose hydrolase-like predicted phosphorylase
MAAPSSALGHNVPSIGPISELAARLNGANGPGRPGSSAGSVDRTRFEAIILDSSRFGSALVELGDDLRSRCEVLRGMGMVIIDLATNKTIADVADQVAAHGITGRLIAVVGDTLPAGLDSVEWHRAVIHPCSAGRRGLESVIALLDRQVALRVDRRVPDVDADPAWTVQLPEGPAMQRACEALGTLANGLIGVRARREDDRSGSVDAVVVSGIYTDHDGQTDLLGAPDWTRLSVSEPVAGSQSLDLRSGVLYRRGGTLRSLRFVSATRADAMAMRAECDVPSVCHAAALAAPAPPTAIERSPDPHRDAARTRSTNGGGIVVAVHDQDGVVGGRCVIERLATLVACQQDLPDWDDAADSLDEVVEHGFDRLLADHRAAWARRWASARIDIEGCPRDELAARFAIFHLLASAREKGEAVLGARGLSGSAYGGHVFWDADVFVLPALSALRPAAARAMLEYRVRRLPAAHRAARAAGRDGARFPWESAATGDDVTPRHALGVHGEDIPIRTGEQEEHIVADVAWAANEYASWAGDSHFLGGPGAGLILDTARYWASRVAVDDDGSSHLRGVIGPDEYHEDVDDNAYTNVMARWNLRRGAELLEELGRRETAANWRRLADKLVDGWSADRGLYEQFAGYWNLEPLLIAQVADPPVAADVLLGPVRIGRSQLIKQADVLMLHHLVPDEVERGSLNDNLAYYGPRTAHGSSLSPAIHAALLARAGEPDRALKLFRMALRLDLDDLTGTTAGGLHLATMGGVWQALAYGFCGLRPRSDALHVDPALPAEWSALTLRLMFHGMPIGIRVDHDRVGIDCVQQLTIRVGAGEPQSCDPPGGTFMLDSRPDGVERERRKR